MPLPPLSSSICDPLGGFKDLSFRTPDLVSKWDPRMLQWVPGPQVVEESADGMSPGQTAMGGGDGSAGGHTDSPVAHHQV